MYHSRCFCVLLQMSKADAVILPNELTGVPNLVRAEFKTKCTNMGCAVCCSGVVNHPISFL